jgi:hypothetical protein
LKNLLLEKVTQLRLISGAVAMDREVRVARRYRFDKLGHDVNDGGGPERKQIIN